LRAAVFRLDFEECFTLWHPSFLMHTLEACVGMPWM
jgi:hypothetical protein